MPDEIATRAHLLLMLGLVAGLALIPVVGWLWRLVTGAREGASAGTAVGGGLWAACLLYAAFEIGGWVTSLRQGAQAEGRITGFEARKTAVGPSGTVAQARTATLVVPQIVFRTPDGREHRFDALGGSLEGRKVGDRVTVRYDPANPASATTADFQNERGALAFFAWLGGIVALVAVWMGWGAVGDLQRERASPAPGARGKARRAAVPTQATGGFAVWRDGPGQAWRPPLRRAGLLCLVLALVLPFVLVELQDAHLLEVFGFAFVGIAAALLCFGLAAALERGAASAHVLFGRLIGVAGFGGFAFILWALRGG
jgi:hypothetical protein